MTSSKVLDVPFDGPPVARIPALKHRCDLSGISVTALPPGEIEVRIVAETYFLDINLSNMPVQYAANRDRLNATNFTPETVAFAAPGTDFRLRGQNNLWGIVIELEPDRATSIDLERLDGSYLPSGFYDYHRHGHAAQIGRYLIDHLRRPRINHLYTEGMALAALGATLSRITGADAPPVRGHDIRITRVIDYIETHYGKQLAVAELAGVAAMSPSHFSKCFKASTGEAVWAYVQRRRCERARETLLYTNDPIAQIAYACGFANQGHLTSVFRKMFDVTPGAIRSGAAQ
ncbi:helix-turn-helix domain-containing protein [Roseobacter weihaiensis]|uniref:helix-turn-helix domain-containing protein n=1 Tax=Roseobacter weihaiensis TaxID=2763262 RepID=UPI001D0BA626|nr:AraC family transcriptional regulator [Roseobacter sp. H9]